MTVTVGEDGRDSEEVEYSGAAPSAERIGATTGYAL